ncbi:MAG TPA: monovalent cation/H+ antiporter subunit D [Casimicrobiaceae bacterium]|nr:monovalent cation/H+ antiporter subunit D [Casimicrobiaceae bacterium]
MSVLQHLVIVPIVLPLFGAAVTLLIDERRLAAKAAIGVVLTIALVVVAIALLAQVDAGGTRVYRVGDWPAPFGIVLVADRLSAAMVLLASVLGLACLVFSLARWHREGPRFHALVQFLLMGVNGAFLTGDLFNLFVFVEVLLAASYGLALHGSGTPRVRNGLQYIVVNLVASLLFLIGASLIYGATGTLNLADLAARFAQTGPGDRVLVETAAAILGVAFLTKAGMWPLCFWLPGTYSAASAPSAALFAILTKVGVYIVLRIWLLLFAGEGASSGFGASWLAAGGMATIAFGIVGVLASQNLARLASYSVLVSSGTVLAVVAQPDAAVTSAALYYLVGSTLALAALFLLVELVERGRMPGADVLAVTAEAFAANAPTLEADDETGVAIPATMALLGVSFVLCALMLAGLPPLAGFVGKFALLGALLAPSPVPGVAWAMLVLLLVAGLAVVIAMGRAGVRRFWASPEATVPRVRVIEMAPVALLLALCAAMTVEASPVMRYFGQAAEALHAPRDYVDSVLSR